MTRIKMQKVSVSVWVTNSLAINSIAFGVTKKVADTGFDWGDRPQSLQWIQDLILGPDLGPTLVESASLRHQVPKWMISRWKPDPVPHE